MALQAAPPYPRNLTRPTLLAGAFLLALALFTALIHTAIASSIPGADYYTFWTAGRALFLEHKDPYSQEVIEQTQMGKFGHLVGPGEDQQAYAYPLYGLLITLPTILLTFDWAISFWMAFNILLFLTICFMALPPPARGFSITSLLIFPIFLGLILGTVDILLGAGIFVFFGMIVIQNRQSRGMQILAGVLLAWSTMKPQFIWLVLMFALLYALRERLYPFLAAFFAALAFFLGLSFALVPGWLGEWITRVREYAIYVQGRPTLSEFFALMMPAQAALTLTGVVFALCAGLTIYLIIRWWRGELHWFKILAWLGMLTYLFHLHGIAYEQLIFFIPLILWLGIKSPGLSGVWRSKELLVFWLASLIFSWVAFAGGMDNLVIDRSPVLLNAVWVGWLFSKPRLQL
jgi:hypothetical protein